MDQHDRRVLVSTPFELEVASALAYSQTMDAMSMPGPSSLKRRASSPLGRPDTGSRKKARATAVDYDDKEAGPSIRMNDRTVPGAGQEDEIDGRKLAEDLQRELECGICSALVYQPVMVNPCQHFFCGSCCKLWIKNGGTNCPACRGMSSTAIPSRGLQMMVDVLLRAAPSMTRTERERAQADEVYRSGEVLRIPFPAPSSPPPQVPPSTEFVRPCPYCAPDNPLGWRCAWIVPDPDAHPDQAWKLEDGPPPGHAFCGNCEDLMSVDAPVTTKCDLCHACFCGLAVPGRCTAALLMNSQPQGFADNSDLIQSLDIYDAFDSNSVEVEYMLDYLTTHQMTPRYIYREIATHLRLQPSGFQPLVDMGLFDINGNGPASDDREPARSPTRMCRVCAGELFIWGIRDWWARERRRGQLDPEVAKRPDCADGRDCTQQKDSAHSRQYNHIIAPPDGIGGANTDGALPNLPAVPTGASARRDLAHLLGPTLWSRSDEDHSASSRVSDIYSRLSFRREPSAEI